MVTAKNPILTGFYPDPSICRAGDDFYIVNSTLYMHPVCLYSTAGIWHIGSRLAMFWTGKNSFR